MKFFTQLAHAGQYLALSCLLAACLGGGESATTAQLIPTPTPATPSLALFVGNMGGQGNIDGPVATARFNSPNSVAIDSAGNVYVADSGNYTIRKISPAGVVSTLAGTAGVWGNADGIGAAASFNELPSIAVDGAGNVFVADSLRNTIRKVTPEGVVSTLAGTPGVPGTVDGAGATARFYHPAGIATDSAGNVYVAESWNSTIRKVTPEGVVSTLAGTVISPGAVGVTGSADGIGSAASFHTPSGLATDSAGNVYVADTGNHTIRKITPDGMVSTLAGMAGVRGGLDGHGSSARFRNPIGVSTDSAGNVYVADTGNHALRKITPSGMVSTLAGHMGIAGGMNGNGVMARFDSPSGVATDSAGNVYVADPGNSLIRKVTMDGVVNTLAGIPRIYGEADGSAAKARFNRPSGGATDSAGNIYVADSGNYTIRKISPAGVVSTLAGTAGVWGNADGIGAAASFYFPTEVATDSAGNVYVTDTWNYTIRKVTPRGRVTTLAGSPGIPGSADGIGSAARFDVPRGIATDKIGNVYVSDSRNSTIRKITPEGVVTTLAGVAGILGSANGIGPAASFFNPLGIATDSSNNIYVADPWNQTIRKITPAGEVSTLAGAQGISGNLDGAGTEARFNMPTSLATDSSGNVYVVDSSSHTIRKITPEGVVSTVVGVAGVEGFIPGALPGVISYPMGITISGTTLYIIAYDGVAVVNNVP